MWTYRSTNKYEGRSQSLFYWITYSYNLEGVEFNLKGKVSILILLDYLFLSMPSLIHLLRESHCLNPYFIGLPILISIKENMME